MMISTHGYVAPEPEFGKPDTGGQVVFVLELSRCLTGLGYHVDILTRQFEGQAAEEEIDSRMRLLRFPCGGGQFVRKETLCESIPEWVEKRRPPHSPQRPTIQLHQQPLLGCGARRPSSGQPL